MGKMVLNEEDQDIKPDVHTLLASCIHQFIQKRRSHHELRSISSESSEFFDERYRPFDIRHQKFSAKRGCSSRNLNILEEHVALIITQLQINQSILLENENLRKEKPIFECNGSMFRYKCTFTKQSKTNGTPNQQQKNRKSFIAKISGNVVPRKCYIEDTSRPNHQQVKSKIQHLLRNNRIHTTIKTMFYKSIIRPIICYAAPVWANPSLTSSAQMERIRLSERKILRSTTNTRRERGVFRFANNSTLYRKTNTQRIDRFIANNSLKFIDRCYHSEDQSIKEIANTNQSTDSKYLPVSFWSKWNASNKLLDNNELRIFNKSHRDPSRTVYSTNQ